LWVLFSFLVFDYRTPPCTSRPPSRFRSVGAHPPSHDADSPRSALDFAHSTPLNRMPCLTPSLFELSIPNSCLPSKPNPDSCFSLFELCEDSPFFTFDFPFLFWRPLLFPYGVRLSILVLISSSPSSCVLRLRLRQAGPPFEV